MQRATKQKLCYGIPRDHASRGWTRQFRPAYVPSDLGTLGRPQYINHANYYMCPFTSEMALGLAT